MDAHLVLDVHHVVGFVLAAEQGHSAAFDVVARYRGAVWVGAHLVPDVHHVVGFVLATEQGHSAAFDVVAWSRGAVWVGAQSTSPDVVIRH